MTAGRLVDLVAGACAVLVIAVAATSWALAALRTRRRTDAALTPAEPVPAVSACLCAASCGATPCKTYTKEHAYR